MTYTLLKRIIERGGYDRSDILEKMDVFLLNNRITIEQYNELLAMMPENEAED